MADAKAVSTPIATTEKFSDGSPPADPKLDRQALGSLQYLSLTRPDVSFSFVCHQQALSVHALFIHTSLVCCKTPPPMALVSCSGKANLALFTHLQMPIGPVILMIELPLLLMLFSLESLGVRKSKRQLLDPPPKPNIGPLPPQPLQSIGS